MKKITTDLFIKKCRAELRRPEASIHSVARKMQCSAVTIYRVTGGRARVLAGTSDGWMREQAAAKAAGGKTTRKRQKQVRRNKKLAHKRAVKARQKRKLTPREAACAL